MRPRKSGTRFSLSKLRQTALAWCFLLPTLIVMGLFIFYPMLKAFHLSLYEYQPLAEKKYIGLRNFSTIFQDQNFVRSLINSIKYLIVVPVIVVLSLILALLVEPRVPGVNFFRASYYIPVVTSMVVVGITWSQIFNEDVGILNHLLLQLPFVKSRIHWLSGVNVVLYTIMSVTIWKGLGYYMVIFIAGLKAIPEELIEAAMIDGAKKWQQTLYVKVPMLWPAITLVAIISSIFALQVFDEVFVMTRGNPLHYSSTLVYYIYETGLDPKGAMDMGIATAMGVVLFVLILVFTIFAVKLMQRGYAFER